MNFYCYVQDIASDIRIHKNIIIICYNYINIFYANNNDFHSCAVTKENET